MSDQLGPVGDWCNKCVPTCIPASLTQQSIFDPNRMYIQCAMCFESNKLVLFSNNFNQNLMHVKYCSYYAIKFYVIYCFYYIENTLN